MSGQAVPGRMIRTDFSTGEVVGALVWLSLGAALSCLLEVVYLGTWVTLPSGARLPVPYTIIIAFLFNLVLTRTALLWTTNKAVAGIPLWAWLGVFAALTFAVSVTGDQLVGASPRALLLVLAAAAGGGWPLVVPK